LLAFAIWLTIDIPFSIWRGSSLQLVSQYWLKSVIVFVAMAGLICSIEHCRRAMNWIAFATGVLACISLLLGDTSSGRLLMGNDSKFSNPNDLAHALLMGLPFWVLMARNPRRTPFRKVIPLIFTIIVLIVLAKTGSRGAFLTFCVLYLIVFWNASVGGKLSLAITAVAIAGLAYQFLPRSVIKRYVTVSSQSEYEPLNQVEIGGNNALQASAVESAVNRVEMLKESLRLTVSHPIFGVGPGMFA